MNPSLARRDPPPPRRVILVLGWAGMRGGVSLAAALALPGTVPERDLLVFVAFMVILATLVGQGLTLPLLIRRLGIRDDSSVEAEVPLARAAAAEAALGRLDDLAAELPEQAALIGQLHDRYARRAERYVSQHHEQAEGGAGSSETEEVRRAVLLAQRRAVIDLRQRREIGD